MPSEDAIDSVRRVQSAFRVLTTYLQLSAHLFPPQQQIQDNIKADYIVVGAGSSGSVIANRLTEDPDTTVLLIEAGGDPPVESVLPGLVPYLKGTSYDWNFRPEKEGNNYLKNDVPQLLQGKMLGGTTSINYMSYVRGAPGDYDAWAELVNDDNWKYENLLKYFIRSEDLRDRHKFSSEVRKYHGSRGYMGVTKEDNNATYVYLKAFQEAGYELIEDINVPNKLGYTQPMNIIDDGYRQSTGYAFLSKIERENLILYRNTLVTKILFDDNRKAIGVTAVHNNKQLTFHANKEVIVAAGVFNTPKLLMLSQIGPKDELTKLNIRCISDLPVGKNLQYINAVGTVIKMGNQKYEGKLNPRKFPSPVVLGTTASYGTSSYVVNPDLFSTFCAYSVGYENEICDKFYNDADGSELLFSAVGLLHPKSRGSVTLKSRNYNDAPIINLRTFSVKEDLINLSRHVQKFMEVVNTDTLKSLEAEALYLDLQDTSANKGSLEYWISYSSKMAIPYYSYAGTCSMGSVVDTNLRVYGVQNLRVADASIIPLIPAAIMDIPTVMIGEKAADLIRGPSAPEPLYDTDSDEDDCSSDSNSSESSNSSENNNDDDEGNGDDSNNNTNENTETSENNGESTENGPDEQDICCKITTVQINQYIQEIMSQLRVSVKLVITEIKENETIGVTYISKNIELTVQEIQSISEIFISGVDENGTYNTTYIESFVQQVVQIFKQKEVTMINEITSNTKDGYTQSDKREIRSSISYCTNTIVRYIQQKRAEIIQHCVERT